MDLTLFFTQVFGVYVLVVGLSGLLYPDRAKRAMEEVTKSYILPYFDGAFALLLGLVIVITHNVWGNLAETLITLIGWLAVLEGVVMLLLPQQKIADIAKRFSSRGAVTTWSAAAIAIGGYLTYVGFFM